MEIKYPNSGGVKRVSQAVNDLRNRNPSEKFIKIINEISKHIDEEDGVKTPDESRDQAALPPETNP